MVSISESAIVSRLFFNKQLSRVGSAALLFLCVFFTPTALATVYMTAEAFVENSFELEPTAKNLWLKEVHQQAAKKLLGHPYRSLRLRYWEQGDKTAWVLDEIGKEEPITIGVVISNNQIQDVKILSYRESRGGEVRHPFFTNQFVGLFLKPNDRLSARINGISGATLSVRAVSNISRYALYLSEQLSERSEGEQDKPLPNQVEN